MERHCYWRKYSLQTKKPLIYSHLLYTAYLKAAFMVKHYLVSSGLGFIRETYKKVH